HRDRDAASSEETHVEAVAVLGEQEVGIVMDHFLDLSVAMPDRVEAGVRAAEGELVGLARLETGRVGVGAEGVVGLVVPVEGSGIGHVPCGARRAGAVGVAMDEAAAGGAVAVPLLPAG